jgi:hypothetical protein
MQARRTGRHKSEQRLQIGMKALSYTAYDRKVYFTGDFRAVYWITPAATSRKIDSRLALSGYRNDGAGVAAPSNSGTL